MKKQIKEKQKFRTITITEDAFDALEFLSTKSRANKSLIVSDWLEQVAKVVYPLEFATHINFMFAPNERGDKIICFFSPMIFGQVNLGNEKVNEIIGEKLVDAATDKLVRNSAKKKGEK